MKTPDSMHEIHDCLSLMAKINKWRFCTNLSMHKHSWGPYKIWGLRLQPRWLIALPDPSRECLQKRARHLSWSRFSVSNIWQRCLEACFRHQPAQPYPYCYRSYSHCCGFYIARATRTAYDTVREPVVDWGADTGTSSHTSTTKVRLSSRLWPHSERVTPTPPLIHPSRRLRQ